MDEFKELTIEYLRDFLNNNEHKYQTAQQRLCFAIIKRMYRRVCQGYRFGQIRICRYKNMVVDGNHTYISYSLAGILNDESDYTSSHCDMKRHYGTVEIDEIHDWDDFTEHGRKCKSDEHLNELTRVIKVI
ncbi:hypothetical protein CA265_03795 [Sphingobacteriaceae bacterium GW460-11-11-14-LB5]|nr:hypothetical protein CA265_03795 [Sphingobacteriaceae bacterium GW460-11-11-14-LB5]